MKKFLPTLTIGISAYNEEANIAALINALLLQKRELYVLDQIVVISDGSTDGTVSEVNKIKHQNVKLIVERVRCGQNVRQNELIEMSQTSDYLLFMEADTLPATADYVDQLVAKVPSSGKFSIIVGNTEPLPSCNLFSQVLYHGFRLKNELFTLSAKNNLYLCPGGRLMSRQFRRSFRFENGYHEDSYCYRCARKSGLPIFRANGACLNFKLVTTLSDYLKQSGKFQKARRKEKQVSDVYKLNLPLLPSAGVLFKNLIRKPHLTLAFMMLVAFSRIHSLSQPNYTIFWPIYHSSKQLPVTTYA